MVISKDMESLVAGSSTIRKLFEEKTGKIPQLLYQYIIYNSDNPFSFSIGMSRKTFKKLYPGIETRKEEEW